jgi:SAM-dependent methyltransferase
MSKTVETNRDWRTHWNTVNERVAKDELLRQVERTVAGQPLPQEQIALLLGDITGHLNLGPADILLDLCCGNGLLTAHLAERCGSAVGIDYSRDLVEIARERNVSANTAYLQKAAEDIVAADFPAGRPNKVSMNAGLQHFTRDMVAKMMPALREAADPQMLLFFTDVPDGNRIDAFYNTPERWAEYERRRAAGTEAIGTWWDRNDLTALMEIAGFEVTLVEPAPQRQTSHYRFDVLGRLAQ